MRVEIYLALEHGIMFLSDPYVDEEIPQNTGAGEFTSTRSCVTLQLPSYVDGEAHVIVSSEAPSTERPVFSHRISAPSNVLSLSDSQRFNYCMFPIRGGEAQVEIWRFGANGQEKWIRIVPLDLF